MDPTKPNSLDTSPSASQTNNTKTFAETTANIQFPKKDQEQSFLTLLKMSLKLSILKPSVNLLHQPTSHSHLEYLIIDFAFTLQIKILSNK
ncbi:unnamed protein product [Macrosiphum euphorbiae]|uniref:Uncharacterized protein n=1 Tax=Macrosiphum euphorbiae TaxID=13131 RepID=A0AAV0XMG8_9HEMI|nr:unnamed protein product [Macrosiphum euphorbiae]